MKSFLLICALLFTTVAFSADSSKAKDFFDKNKIGNSADYGVFKRDTDYIITVHGFDNDLEVCIEIINMLNKQQPDTYTCKPLNH